MTMPETGLCERRKTMMILVASPLTENIYRRIGAEELVSYFEVVVADCLAWLISSDRHPAFSEKRSTTIRKVDSFQAFAALMQSVAPDFVLDFVGRGPYTRMFQAECSKAGAQYITHHLAPVPTSALAATPWDNLFSSPAQFARKALRHIGRRLANKHPYPPDISLLAGRKSANPWVMSARKIVQTATPGYFELQRARYEWDNNVAARLDLPEGGYILFIDDCLALSFDFHLGHFSRIVDARSYFELLNGFFDRLEGLTGLPVVIAAHPNGREYPGYAALFKGRRTYDDRTAWLACGCACALTHYSSAINFPVILRKPVALLTFDRLREAPQGRVVEVIASALQRRILELSQQAEDGPTLSRLLAPAQEAAYASYEADYIVNTRTPGSNPFENLAVHLSGLANHLPLGTVKPTS
jgi:hypothetical protein